ncbi:Phytanoyl-CoA dioxygenase (PhyH) [Streptomyces sp. yr375]|uniref:phytanoyl-CoA dioxygenase family protein n=1 Tax=Streptomyces sp. yr375 TaxID=1761906 RepID=UPI0008CFE893|nr:phytanoyl-CoA dioxygenase family protein [Streptomyces sp. yr375]SES03589.1 Phytanoyl-CoA dioxygenase (PhyH) [Streptomyces sp. yr375]
MHLKAEFLQPDDPGIGDALRRDGVAYISGLLDAAQVAEFREVLANYENSILPKARRSSYDSDTSGRLVMYRDVERHEPRLNKMIQQPTFMDLIRRAVDWEPVLYYLDGFPKPAGGSAIEAHQELYTVPVDPPQFLHLWVPLEDVTPENGSIHFYHGTHKLGLAPHIEPPGVAPMVDPAVLQRIENMRVEVTCPAGSAALFTGYTIHWSGPNRGDRDRPAMTLGIRGRNTVVKTEQENIASLMARIFREEGSFASVGHDDDFYALSGHEGDTVVERILARVRNDHGVSISLDDFAQHYRTPKALAARVLILQSEGTSGDR